MLRELLRLGPTSIKYLFTIARSEGSPSGKGPSGEFLNPRLVRVERAAREITETQASPPLENSAGQAKDRWQAQQMARGRDDRDDRIRK
jgi:hypothetical protein